MSKSKTLGVNANAHPLEHLFDQQRGRLKIPYSQRPWEWKNKRIEGLLEDLFSVHERNYFYSSVDSWRELNVTSTPLPHFFGSIILLNDNSQSGVNARYQIIDGQQRITAITILLSHLRVHAKELESEAKACSVLSLSLKAAHLASGIETIWLYADIQNNSKRVESDAAYREVFEKFVVEPQSRVDRESAWRSLASQLQDNEVSKRFRARFERTAQLVDEKIQAVAHEKLRLTTDATGRLTDESERRLKSEEGLLCRLDFIRTVVDCLAKNFVYIQIDLQDEIYASEVFTSLNSKQQQLLQSDLIKAYVFRRCQSPDAALQANNDWHALVNCRPDTDTFFRRLYLSQAKKINEKVKDDQIAEIYKKDCLRNKRDAQVVSVVGNWKSTAEKLKYITEKTSNFLDSSGKVLTTNLFDRLRLQGAEIVYLTMMERASFLKLSHLDKNDLIKLITDYAVRTVKVAGGKIDPFLEKCVAISFHLNTHNNYADIRRSVLQTLSDAHDADFKTNFSSFSTKDTNLQFYLLYEIESALLKGTVSSVLPYPPPERLVNHVEHILPKKLRPIKGNFVDWQEWRDPKSAEWIKEHSEYVNRLGNLCLLEFDVNTTVKNFDFSVKRTGVRPSVTTNRILKTGARQLKSYPSLSHHYGTSKFGLVSSLVGDSWDNAGNLLKGSPITSWGKSEICSRQFWMAEQALLIWKLR